MASLESRRLKVSILLDADLKHKNIASIVGVSVATVEHVAKAKRTSRERKVLLGVNWGLHWWVGEHGSTWPTKSIRQHACEFGCASDTWSRALKWLRIKSYVRRKQQLLKEQSKGKRLKCCKKLQMWVSTVFKLPMTFWKEVKFRSWSQFLRRMTSWLILYSFF